jgi:hypothetical protein
LGHLVDPSLAPWFLEVTSVISRLRKWGAELGHAAIILEGGLLNWESSLFPIERGARKV